MEALSDANIVQLCDMVRGDFVSFLLTKSIANKRCCAGEFHKAVCIFFFFQSMHILNHFCKHMIFLLSSEPHAS